MTIYIDGHDFHYEMQALCMLFAGGQGVRVERGRPAALDDGEIFAGLCEREGGRLLSVRARLRGEERAESELLEAGSPDAERRLGRLCYHVLAQLTGLRPAWGILTGVRPVKLVRALLDEGKTEEDADRWLRDECLVSAEKRRLALDTARIQRPLLGCALRDISLYVSIPFCPSRCRYCSFVSHSVEQAGKLIAPYLRLLREELRELGEKARRFGLRPTAVYFGGGTPTTLETGQLASLFETIAAAFDLSAVREYTVEAGRPDTLRADKLAAMRSFGVNRVSVNPQSLQDAVLELAGRRHTAAQAVEGYHLARACGFETINMDLIAGLEGDTPALFKDTLRRVLALRPENVTVHTLSVKRAANLSGDPAAVLLRRGAAEMVGSARELLTGAGYRPYYLYRQKNMLQNLENTGYSLPGHESAYNVRIMDESQTILAAGAGGVTKLVGGGEITRIFNYKYPYEYIDRFSTLRERRKGIDRFYEKFCSAGGFG